ncbi:hypothetical protein ABEB36_002326 [Hypothenemus hampei]
MEHFRRDLLKKSFSLLEGVWRGFNTMASDAKTQKFITKIGTHDGVFHCDEALACFMLKLLPEYKEAVIIRTRNQQVLSDCDIVVDVGALYNPKTHRYDHHQREFQETLNSIRPDLVRNKFNTIRLSSAGLIYAHFGLEILSEILKKHKECPTTESLRLLFTYVYEGFIEELDAIDNGIPMYDEGKAKFKISTHIGARVNRLNPSWNNTNPEPSDVLFEKAMNLVGSEFIETVLEGYDIWWPAREIVRESIKNRKEIHESGAIIFLNSRCPWKDHLYLIEEEDNIKDEIKFCVFHDRDGDTWRVQGIPIQPDSFICR